MAQDLNALIAMAQSRNAQGAFDPNAQPQAQMDQIAMLVRQGLLSPLQAQQFMAQIQGQQGQQVAGAYQDAEKRSPYIPYAPVLAPNLQGPPPGTSPLPSTRPGERLTQAEQQSPQAQFPQLNFSNPGPQPNPNTGLPTYPTLGIRG